MDEVSLSGNYVLLVRWRKSDGWVRLYGPAPARPQYRQKIPLPNSAVNFNGALPNFVFLMGLIRPSHLSLQTARRFCPQLWPLLMTRLFLNVCLSCCYPYLGQWECFVCCKREMWKLKFKLMTYWLMDLRLTQWWLWNGMNLYQSSLRHVLEGTPWRLTWIIRLVIFNQKETTPSFLF